MSWSLGCRHPGSFWTCSSGSAKSPTSLGSSTAQGTPAPSSALAAISCRSMAGITARRRSGELGPALLVLKDFELMPIRPPGPEDLYDVIDERHERLF